MKKKTIRPVRKNLPTRAMDQVPVKPLTEAIRACFRSLPWGLTQRQGCRRMVSRRDAMAPIRATVAWAAVCAVALAVNDQALAAPENFASAVPNRSAEQVVLGREIVFLDTQVPEYERLATGIKSGREVILLDADRDGIAQITAVLARYGDIDAVHIVSHGQAGRLQLGGSWLSMDNLDDYTLALQGWFPKRREPANRRPDVVIYACDVAEDSLGKAFVERISVLTGADIAASNDRSAATGLGGDWVMEMVTGNIETGLAFTPQALLDYPFALNVFTVTNLDDAGPGSLRQAIEGANANPGADEIVFAGGGANGTIELATDLPHVTDDLSIKGPGAEALAISGGDINFVFGIPTYDYDLGAYDFGSGVVSDVTITGGSIGAELAEVAVTNAVLAKSDGPAIRDSAESAFTLENSIVTGSCSDPEPGSFACAAIDMTGYNYLGELTLKNSIVSGSGGVGVSSSSIARIENSTISENVGSGVAVRNGEVCHLILENSSIFGNKGDGVHDAAQCDEFLDVEILNSTITGNGGNGFFASGRSYVDGLEIEINNSTIAGNDGNGFMVNSAEDEFASVKLQNTILANNVSQDCDNRVQSLGNNLIGDPQGCDIVLQATDLTGDPGLGDFVDSGSPGGGHLPLLATSQAIEAGNNEVCSETDQLGHPRADGDGDGRVVCDMGAVEFFPIVNHLVLLDNVEKSLDPTPAAGAPAGTFTLTATFSNASSTRINNPFFEVKVLTGDNVLLNRDRGAGGVGASLTPDVADKVLAPGESVTVDFEIGLQETKRFRFFVDLLGDTSS